MEEVAVNDCVKVDGKLRGRVLSIVKPLGTYSMFNIKLEDGSLMQVARYRMHRIPDTVSSTCVSTSIETDYDNGDLHEMFKEDFFDPVVVETSEITLPKYSDQSEIADYISSHENVNTSRKTIYDMKIVTRFMYGHNDLRPIEKIPPSELCKLLCKFIINVKKGDGSDYEPGSIRGIISSVDRYLKSKFYGKAVLCDPEFSTVRDVLKTKQKLLKQEGLGNLPNRAGSLSENDIDKLWNSGELGLSNPDSMLNTLWWHNTTHFGLRSVTPHRNIQWGDITLNADSDGIEYLQFTERQTKTRTGVNIRDVRTVTPKAWATGDERCPVAAYKRYRQLRPQGFIHPDTPFYLATNLKYVQSCEKHPWFKRQPVGVNKLSSIMKRMATNAKLLSTKKLTNHSARKYLVQTLSEQNVPPTQIMQISGHKNIQSINNYSHISDEQHKSISKTINGLNGSVSSAASVQNVSLTSHQANSLNSIFASPINNSVINVNFYTPRTDH